MTPCSSLAIQRCSVEPRDCIFVKGYGFLSFAKKMGKNIGRIVSKNLSSKCNQKFFDNDSHSATDALKTTSKRVIKKIAEATGDLIGSKIEDVVSNSYRR